MSDLNDFIKPDTVYELNIGTSFTNPSKASFHQFKYDFTPAAIDKNKEAKINIGARNDVAIEFPHVEGSTEKSTQYIGNKQPCSNKECVLIYDTKSGKFTLERLDSNFFLKKDRQTVHRSVTPTNLTDKTLKKAKLDTSAASSSEQTTNPKKEGL